MIGSSHRRIALVGNSGSGKSTLAQRLAAAWALPVRHVDLIFWQPNWVCTEEKTFVAFHDQWLTEDTWLIEGVGYWQPLLRRFTAANLILFLDTPRDVCHQRAAQRRQEEDAAPNPFISPNCRYQSVQEQQREIIDTFDASTRPALLKLLETEFARPPRQVRVLDGRASVGELVRQLA